MRKSVGPVRARMVVVVVMVMSGAGKVAVSGGRRGSTTVCSARVAERARQGGQGWVLLVRVMRVMLGPRWPAARGQGEAAYRTKAAGAIWTERRSMGTLATLCGGALSGTRTGKWPGCMACCLVVVRVEVEEGGWRGCRGWGRGGVHVFDEGAA